MLTDAKLLNPCVWALVFILPDANNLFQEHFVEDNISTVERRLIIHYVISNSIILIPLIGGLKRLIRNPVPRMRRSNRLTIIRQPVRLAVAIEEVHALLPNIAELAHIPVPDGEVDPLDTIIALVLLALVQGLAEANPVRRVWRRRFRAPFAGKFWELGAFEAPLGFSDTVLDTGRQSVDSDVTCAGTFGWFGKDCQGGQKDGEGSGQLHLCGCLGVCVILCVLGPTPVSPLTGSLE